jgi:hypothetical protein
VTAPKDQPLTAKHRAVRDKMMREEAAIPDAEWKARAALASEAVRPWRDALDGLSATLIVSALELARDEIQDADAIDPRVHAAVRDAAREVLREADIKAVALPRGISDAPPDANAP